jgi:HTH-type transcriptional regulator/antitoxin HigA
MTNYRTPAQMIEDHLRSRGWTQRVLAMVLGLTENKITSIMNLRSTITTELALELQAVLGIDANELLKIQTSYELAKAQLEFRPDPSLTIRAQVFSGLPVAEMIRRGWLPGITDIKDARLESALCKFFRKDSIAEIGNAAHPHAAKKTGDYGEITLAQLGWLDRVRELAEDLPAAKYSRAALQSALSKLRPLMVSPEGVRKVPRIMMESGIRYVIVETLPSAKIDGVCLWLDEKNPVIGMSLRYDRIDNFWFVLRHEIEHVLREHGHTSAMLDAELEHERAGTSSDIPEEERLANEAASDFCVPKAKMENFIARKAPMFAERDIRGFAATLGIHPGLVAGQLQHHTKRYDLFRNHLAKIRNIIAPNAQCDGWGTVVPTSA